MGSEASDHSAQKSQQKISAMSLSCLLAFLLCSCTRRSISLSFVDDQHRVSGTLRYQCFWLVPDLSFQFQPLPCHPWNCLTVSPPQFPCLALFLLVGLISMWDFSAHLSLATVFLYYGRFLSYSFHIGPVLFEPEAGIKLTQVKSDRFFIILEVYYSSLSIVLAISLLVVHHCSHHFLPCCH